MAPTTSRTTSVDHSAAAVLRAVGSVSEELMRATSLLALARGFLGPDAPGSTRAPADVEEADVALEAVANSIGASLGEGGSGPDGARAFGLAQQIGQTRVMLRQAQLAQRSSAIAGVGRALDALRMVRSVADLVRLAPRQVGELGFQRCMLSRVEDNRWVAKSCYVRGDSELADEILAVGSSSRALGHRLIESEIVRHRSPLLVARAQSNDRVDPDFKRITCTTSYVAAPIMIGSAMFGFVHADTPIDSREVGEFDRTLVRTFAECLGYAAERLYYQERLRMIREQISTVVNASDLMDEMIGSNEESTPDPVVAFGAPRHPIRPGLPAGVVDTLTRRELDVLAHMADGESNARIASRLYLSEATVKAHVRQILRKLGAANRAEAVSRYLRAG